MKGRKIKILIYLSPDIRTKINIFITKYFQRPYGALSHIVEEALSNYFDTRESHNTHMHKFNPHPRGHCDAQAIIAHLKSQGIIFQATDKELRKAIEYVRGHDPRTIKKWIKFLIDYRYLKPISHRTFEICKINGNGG